MSAINCSSCGEEHAFEEMEAAFFYPDAYLEIPENERETRTFVSGDFCILGVERFFVRCVVPIPLVDAPGEYHWGVWAEVDRDTFQTILDTWIDPPDQQSLTRLDASIANEIPYYGGTLGQPAQLQRHIGRWRPSLYAVGDSSLSAEQRAGVPKSKVVEYLLSVRQDAA